MKRDIRLVAVCCAGMLLCVFPSCRSHSTLPAPALSPRAPGEVERHKMTVKEAQNLRIGMTLDEATFALREVIYVPVDFPALYCPAAEGGLYALVFYQGDDFAHLTGLTAFIHYPEKGPPRYFLPREKRGQIPGPPWWPLAPQ